MKSLQLQVAFLPSLIHVDRVDTGGSIVIDTLRFSTTAAQALAANCHSIRIARTVQDAQSVAQEFHPPDSVLLCGERHCRRIAGFDLGNSPLEYVPQKVRNKQLIFTTTNGTLAVQAASRFQHCLLGSFVNCSAVARRVFDLNLSHWQIICAGTDGEIAGEDIMAAGAIIAKLIDQTSRDRWQLDDSAILAEQLWKQAGNQGSDLAELLSRYTGGRNLMAAGFDADIEFASQVDILDVVPIRTGTDHGFQR